MKTGHSREQNNMEADESRFSDAPPARGGSRSGKSTAGVERATQILCAPSTTVPAAPREKPPASLVERHICQGD
jgi:hypothetical protein